MHKEYIEFYQTYKKKYGSKTAIFMMVGAFYELYDIQDIETGDSETNVREIVDHLGIHLAPKKSDVGPGKLGFFAGFPEYVLHKWAGRLTSNGWTVVIVDQIKDEKGKVTERKVSRILSPSTHIEQANSTETPYIMTLFFQGQSFGAAILDLTTGSTRTYSGQTRGYSDIWTADDLVQLINVLPPKEILIYWLNDVCLEESHFRRILGLSSNIVVHIRTIETVGSFTSDLVRSEYLQKIYSIQSLLPPRTYLGIRSEQEEFALVYLLQFVEEHDPNRVKSFHRNEPWIPQTKLICGNHALTQLQLTSATNPKESVLGLFDKAISPMGKRALKERLLSPFSEATEIQRRLKEVQDYMMWPEEISKLLERQLRFMFDLPRLHRNILCGSISPLEFIQLFQTYNAIEVIVNKIVPYTQLIEPFTNEQWIKYQKVFRSHISEDKAQQVCVDVSVFNVETYPEIGKKEVEIQSILNQFHEIRREIAKKGCVAEDAIRLEERDKEPFGLKASLITIQQLKKYEKDLPKGTKISELKSGGWIDCSALQQSNTLLQKAREVLHHLIRINLPDACLAISQAGLIWSVMEQWICHVDTTQCIGRVSKERGFHCPIIESAENGSSVDIQQIRHPLVEATSSRISYVKHNVKLDGEKKGWLVFGMNASGKSTLMKATGLCVLLAQAGCFVPAQSMTLRPFRAINTRILNQDNLFAGLSSFAVEMAELRDILRNADDRTLVLGDELCSGTESISAQALVLSGIQWLSKRNAKFIFATHLHDLPNHLNIQKEGVEIWHLHVEYDALSKKLIYDRRLRPGSGSTFYGLEVARAMDLPFEFIEQALANRHLILKTSTQENAPRSLWNTKIIRKECEICKTDTSDLEVHHVQHRASATNGLLPDGSHMNHETNLMIICQKCHDNIHSGKIEVGTNQQTSNGPERVVQNVESPIKNNKFTDKELEIIYSTIQKYSSLSLKLICSILSSKHEIVVSETKLRTMKAANYN